MIKHIGIFKLNWQSVMLTAERLLQNKNIACRMNSLSIHGYRIYSAPYSQCLNLEIPLLELFTDYSLINLNLCPPISLKVTTVLRYSIQIKIDLPHPQVNPPCRPQKPCTTDSARTTLIFAQLLIDPLAPLG